MIGRGGAPPGRRKAPVAGASSRAGKPVWHPVVEFRDRAAGQRFGELVIAALLARFPDLLDEEGAP